jgi:tetratricopeptide (TPR) repeat protein
LQGDGGGAETEWQQAVKIFEQLLRPRSDVPEFRYGLGQAYGNLGWLRSRRKEWREARPYLEKGIAHLEAALKPNPDEPRYLDALRRRTWNLSEVQLALGEPAAAAVLAVKLPVYYRPRTEGCVLAAKLLGRCARVAEGDLTKPEADRKLHANRYADQAMDLLREALQSGYRDPEGLRKDPQLESLRGRDDFRKLLGSIP